MATDDRSPRDIELAQELGEKYGRKLSSYPFIKYQPRTLRQFLRLEPTFAQVLLRDLVYEVSERGRYPIYTPALSASARDSFTADLESVLRLLTFARSELRGEFPVVLPTSPDDALRSQFGAYSLLDVFNDRARRLITGEDERDRDRNLPEWVFREVRSRSNRAATVREEQATRWFMTLFTDSVRSAWEWFQDVKTSYVHYTFHSKPPGGVQVQYHPQYFTSPVVFGEELSTPVRQRVLIGHYYFIGQPPEGKPIRDPTVFFVSPDTKVGNTVLF